MLSDSRVQGPLATLKVANLDQIVVDLRHNTPSMLWVAAGAVVYVVGSAGLFRWAESLPWSPGETLYFTILNVFAGSFQFEYEPSTTLGRWIAAMNPLAGLTLFGMFIAILTMMFVPPDASLSGIAVLGGQGDLGEKPEELLPSQHSRVSPSASKSGSSNAKRLSEDLQKTLTAAEKFSAEDTNTSRTRALHETAARLRQAMERLQGAEQQLLDAEIALAEAERNADRELARAWPIIGLPTALVGIGPLYPNRKE